MVKLAAALRRDFPERFKLFSMKSFKYKRRTYKNNNRLLVLYKGTDGIKTGYVQDSGYNIIVSVKRKGHRLIAAVFGGRSANRRDHHTKILLQRTFKTIAENDRLDGKSNIVVAPTSVPSKPGSKRVSVAGIAPTETTEEDDINDDSWSVQVGSFDRFAPAHLAAGRAARLVPALRGARVVVGSSASQDKRVYISRLSGLTARRANNACRSLKKKKMSCRVVRNEHNTAQGDR